MSETDSGLSLLIERFSEVYTEETLRYKLADVRKRLEAALATADQYSLSDLRNYVDYNEREHQSLVEHAMFVVDPVILRVERDKYAQLMCSLIEEMYAKGWAESTRFVEKFLSKGECTMQLKTEAQLNRLRAVGLRKYIAQLHERIKTLLNNDSVLEDKYEEDVHLLKDHLSQSSEKIRELEKANKDLEKKMENMERYSATVGFDNERLNDLVARLQKELAIVKERDAELIERVLGRTSEWTRMYQGKMYPSSDPTVGKVEGS